MSSGRGEAVLVMYGYSRRSSPSWRHRTRDGMASFDALDREYVPDPDWPRRPHEMIWPDVCVVGIGPEDHVHVLCRGLRPLLIFPSDERLLAVPEAGVIARPLGGWVRPDQSWLITDEGMHALVVLSRTGEAIVRIGGPSSSPFNRPQGVAVASSGDLHVGDGNARVHRFNRRACWPRSWGEPGPGPARLRLPQRIHVDARGRVWIADWADSRLRVCKHDGSLMHVIEGFEGPAGIAMDCEGVVFVAEEEWRVSMLDQDMRIVARWDSRALPMAARSFVAPHCIAVDSNGDLYVGEVAKAYRGVSRGPRALQKLRRTR
ncbi:MAG: hypothetical protein AB7N65_20010 [Vicinamibacterales bacterium]